MLSQVVTRCHDAKTASDAKQGEVLFVEGHIIFDHMDKDLLVDIRGGRVNA